jgi:predicted O-methyltransferase YrrM
MVAPPGLPEERRMEEGGEPPPTERVDYTVLATVGTQRLLERVFRPALRPTMDAFAKVAAVQSTDPEAVATAMLGIDAPTFARFSAELPEPGGSVARTASPRRAYPDTWQLERAHASLLYAIVRTVRPRSVVETGVADGLSSWALLSALKANGTGHLTSVDIAHDVGALVPADLRSGWELIVLRDRGRAPPLSEILGSRAPVDLFLHDSLHTYGHQLREYSLAWTALGPNGFLLSDDVDASFAFLDMARRVRRAPYVLVGARKMFGALPRFASPVAQGSDRVTPGSTPPVSSA